MLVRKINNKLFYNTKTYIIIKVSEMGFLSKVKQTIRPDPDYPLVRKEEKWDDVSRYSTYPLEVENSRTLRKSENQRYLHNYREHNPDEIPPRNWSSLTEGEKREYIKEKMRRDRKKKTMKKSMKRKPAKKVIKKCRCK